MFNIGLLAVTIGFSMQSCVDPFEPEVVTFKSALVIEATITDENKYQEIKVSRTFALDTTGLYGEQGAQVAVTDANGTRYDFLEIEEGKYVSTVSFAAQSGLGYALSVITKDNSTYSSEEVVAPQPTQIDSLYAERDFKDGEANEGMFIYANSFDPTGNNQYYRYEYEETYKIIAPYWGNKEYVIVDGILELLPKTRENLTCYNTVPSIDVIQTTASDLSDSRISKFPVRFLNRNDFKITNRYSIKVKQYVQDKFAFVYYETLNKLNSSENLFSQIQNGFLVGNIISDNDKIENVVGYFQVSSVSSERIFFNYTDYFPNEPRPEFPADCYFTFQTPTIVNGESLGDLVFFEEYDIEANSRNLSPPLGDILTVPRPCGDCTVFGSNVVPDFWVEE